MEEGGPMEPLVDREMEARLEMDAEEAAEAAVEVSLVDLLSESDLAGKVREELEAEEAKAACERELESLVFL